MIFPNYRALIDYTKQTKRYFPLDEAKEENLVKILLRHIKGRA